MQQIDPKTGLMVVGNLPADYSFVTMRQARIALLEVGLLDSVESAIASIPDPVQRKKAEIEWNYSQEVQRHNGFVSVLAPMLGLTDEQTDQLFMRAKLL